MRPASRVADPTPPGLTFVSNAGDCTTAFPCALGTLPAGATRTITATFAIPPGYTTPDPIANTATVSSPTPDAAAGNNSAPRPRQLGAPVTDLHITKTNGVNGVVRRPDDDLHDHGHEPARAKRRDRRHGHRRLPGGADRRDVDVHGHAAAARAPPSGSGNINTPVTCRSAPASSSPPPARSIRRPPASSSTRRQVAPARRAARTARRRPPRTATPSPPQADLGITKTGPASIVAGQCDRLHDHGHQHRAVGRRGRDRQRCRRRRA